MREYSLILKDNLSESDLFLYSLALRLEGAKAEDKLLLDSELIRTLNEKFGKAEGQLLLEAELQAFAEKFGKLEDGCILSSAMIPLLLKQGCTSHSSSLSSNVFASLIRYRKLSDADTLLLNELDNSPLSTIDYIEV